MGSRFLLIIFSLFLIVFSVHSQLIETKLLPNDAHPNHGFGCSVALDSMHAVIGASEDVVAAASGSAYIFKKDGENWVQEQKLTPDDGEWAGHFGFSVAISRNDIFVSKRNDSEKGSWSGAVYWYQYNDDSTWIEKKKIMASDEEIGDYFGSSIAISGEYAIIGATGVDGETNNDGAAYIYQKPDTSWIEKYKIIPDSLVGEAYFGNAVDIDGDWAIIGAYNENEIEREAGAAYIYQRVDSTKWVLNKKLHRNDKDEGYNFGFSVAISGEYAAVGEIVEHNLPGFVYVYKYDAGENTWKEYTCLTDSSNDSGICYGYSISLNENYLAVGVPEDRTIGIRTGVMYLYKKIEDNWVLLEKVYASDGGDTDYFGRSAFLYEDNVICGVTRYAIGDTISSGIAYIYSGINGLTDIYQTPSTIPENFFLFQNYPNPFNPKTTIRYTVGAQNLMPKQVDLSIYNILGQKVCTLISEKQKPGTYGAEWDAKGFSSGIYFYRLRIGNFIQTKRMLLIK